MGDEVEVPTKERAVFSSRLAFYFAAVGAAVGFGNVWRFPSLSVQYGGGAFFIPYLLALFLLGIPITILEVGFGQFYQTGDVGVFGGFHRRLRGVGLSSVACAFMLVTYYSVLIAWVVHAFFDSFSDRAPWTDEDVDGGTAISYFVSEIIGTKTLVEGGDGSPTTVVGKNVAFSALVWLVIYLCLAGGIKWTGRITYVTMGLPIILLFVFLIKSATLPGASDGIREYIGIWDVSILRTQSEVWSVACSQIFFSIGVTFGILTAYGSHVKRDEPAVLNSIVIALSNSMFSFISGFAVFSALGHLAVLEDTEVTSLNYGGFALVFGTWPVVLGTLPGGVHWVRLLFVNLFLLGLDSAFAMMEAVLTVLTDTVYFGNVSKAYLAIGPCLLAFLLSIIYCTDAGLNFLDVIDFYINFVMLIVGFFETFGSGWAYGIVQQFEHFGKPAVLTYMFANFGSILLACGLWFGLSSTWAGFVGLVALYIPGLAATGYFLNQTKAENPERWESAGAMWWDLAFGNIVHLRNRIQKVIGPVPFIWCFLVKQFIPHVLIVLFINLATSSNGSEEDPKPIFGGYGGYAMTPFQVLGILTFCFAVFLFLLGIVAPSLYDPLAVPQNKEAAEDFKGEYAEDATPAKGEVGGKDAAGGSEEEPEEMDA